MTHTYLFIVFFILFSTTAYANDEYSVNRLRPTECLSPSSKSLYDAQCYSLTVAENPAQPSGPTLDLHLLKIPSINEETKSPLFIIVGGPGQAATDHAAQLRYQFREINQQHDLVFIDQRGTGRSSALQCDLSTPNSSLSPLQQQSQGLNELRDCVQNFTANLAFYSTPFAVNDIESVRAALGYQQINLWGVSYGTRVVLNYMRQYPDYTRSAILDGTAPVEIQLPTHIEQDSSIALANLLNQCATEPSCNRAFPYLKKRWTTLLTELKKTPLTLSLPHPRNQKKNNVFINHEVVSSWVRIALYVRDFSPLIPLAIDNATKGNFELLYSFGTYSEGLTDSISMGMQLAVICSEDVQFKPASQAHDNAHTVQKLLYLNEHNAVEKSCAYFPKGNLPADYFAPIKSKVPTLLLSGSVDPATPPKWAEGVAKHLTNHTHIIVNGGHHGVSSLGCIPRLLHDFIAQANVNAINSTCTNTIKPLPLFIDSAGPKMATTQTTVEQKEND